LTLRPHSGRGLAAVVLARARRETLRGSVGKVDLAWAATERSLDDARADLKKELAQAGYADAYWTLAGTLVTGRRAQIPVDRPAGMRASCIRIDAVAGAPLTLIDASLWDDGGRLLSTNDGVSQTTVFACQKKPGRLDLETRGRPGPFAVTARAEQWSDPVFAASPIAAGRMLGVLGDGPMMSLKGAPVPVRRFSLDSARVERWEETIPLSQCLKVGIGIDGEGGGLTVRAFDTQTGDELDRAHGQRATQIRACASAVGPRRVRIETAIAGGKVDVVAGARMVP
jgi:hypothetical protein